MAAGELPAPGTEYGPCVNTCQHRDCTETRKMASTLCSLCDRPIGYEVRFYDHPLRHAVCEEEEQESIT